MKHSPAHLSSKNRKKVVCDAAKRVNFSQLFTKSRSPPLFRILCMPLKTHITSILSSLIFKTDTKVFHGWCDYARVNNKHARACSQIPLSDMCYMCDYVQIRRTRNDYYNLKL